MRKLLIGAGAVALALGTGGGAAEAATPARAAATGPAGAAPAWRVTQTTGIPGDDLISDIAVAPTGSTWAVGERFAAGVPGPLVQHLSKGTWRPVTLPKAMTKPLAMVGASSSKNVWALGTDGTIARWNGTKWTSAKLSGGFRPSDVGVLSASNVWVVGPTGARHWTGGKWVAYKLPAAAEAVYAASSRNVWAVGERGDKGAVMHWNGSSWKLVRTVSLPKPADDATVSLAGVTVSGGHVWATGGQEWACGEDGDDQCFQPLALKLTGKTWRSLLGRQNGAGGFGRVAADGMGGVWMLQGAWDPSFAHVTGNTITFLAAPRPAGHDVNLTALAHVPGMKTVWSAGGSYPQGDPDDPTGDGVYLRTG